MTENIIDKRIAVLLSGGVDSSVVVWWRALVSYRGTDAVPESLDQRMYIETGWLTIIQNHG